MNKLIRYALSAAGVFALTAAVNVPANAAMVAYICNDILCSGGDDVIVTDNLAGDSIPSTGAITFATAAYGYSILVNTAQSMPIIGNPITPQLDLTYVATSPGAVNPVFLFVTDSGFLNGGQFLLTLGGTNSGGSGSVTGRAWGGTTNIPFQFSAANLIGADGPLTGAAYSSSASGAFNPVVSPYSLTIGVVISRTSAGTTTGDLNFQVAPAAVPEPSTWAMMLLGLAGIGFMAYRRSRKDQGVALAA